MGETLPSEGTISGGPRVSPRTHVVDIAGVTVGGGEPVVIQAMTSTETADATATAAQVADLVKAGAELVRLAIDTPAAARALPEIHARLEDAGVGVPLVGDFHYNGHVLLRRFPAVIDRLAKIRINPGNVGAAGRDDGAAGHDDPNFQTMIAIARDAGKAVRIGVNGGSVDPHLVESLREENARRGDPRAPRDVILEAIATSALRAAEAAERQGLGENRIILSAKVSQPHDLFAIYEALAARSRYALHLGLTEAGPGTRGIVASAAALAPLLMRGIGDTIRISLTPAPGDSRTLEVEVAKQLLQSLGLRAFAPTVTACPGCGRTSSTRFLELADEVDAHLRECRNVWKARYPGVERLRVAVMGCVVNGPGEARDADIGVSLPGRGEKSKALVMIDGKEHDFLEGPAVAARFLELLDAYVDARFAPRERDDGGDESEEAAREDVPRC